MRGLTSKLAALLLPLVALSGCGRTSPTSPVSQVRASSPLTAGTISGFGLPSAFTFPASIVTGPDGALWFVEAGKIGRMTTAGGLSEFVIPGGHAALTIAKGPDGALWFTEPANSAIGRITTHGTITETKVPGACTAGYSCPLNPRPQSIVTGSDGALWFTEQVFSKVASRTTAGKIVRLTTAGAFTEYALPGGGAKVNTPNPGALAAGPDGALWFTDSFESRIWRATTTGALSWFASPSGQPTSSAAGPDGALWFTAGKLTRLSTAGAVTAYAVPSGPNGASLGSIATGPDGNLWLAKYDMTTSAGSIVRSTTSGGMTSFAFPTYVEIDGITAGPDGAMWFTQSNNQSGAAKIGRITTR